jgi:hypothetical protein
VKRVCGSSSSILLPPGRPQLHIDVLQHADEVEGNEGEGNEGAMVIDSSYRDTQENQRPGTMVIMEQPCITAPELSPSDSLSPVSRMLLLRRPDGKAANAAFLRMRAARSPARKSTAPEQSSPLVQEVAHMFSKSGIAPRPLPHWLDRSSPMPPPPPPTARE